MGPVVRSQCCVVLRVGGVGMYSCVAFVRSVESEGVVDVVTSTGWLRRERYGFQTTKPT